MDAVQRRGSAERMNYIKRFGCMLLTFVFCFSLMQPPKAKASAVATAAVSGLLVQLLVGAGVTLQTSELARRVTEDFLEDHPEVKQMLLDKMQVVKESATGAYKVVCDFGDDLWHTACAWVDENFNVGNNEIPNFIGINVTTTVYDASSGINKLPLYIFPPSGFSQYYFLFDIYNNQIRRRIFIDGALNSTKTYGLNGSSTVMISYDDSTRFYLYINSVGVFAEDYPVRCSVVGDPGVVVGEEHYIDDVGREWDNKEARSISVPLWPSTSGIAIGNDFYDAQLDSILGWVSGDPYVDADGVAHGATQAKTYKDVAAQSKVVGIPLVNDGGTLTLPKADAQYEVGDATIGQIQTATQDSTLQALLITRFPFSIPWDFYNALKLLAAPPKVPYWEVDFMAPIAHRVGGWKGDTKIVIDFSEYELLGQLSRWLTTIMFVAALAMGTKKLMWTA